MENPNGMKKFREGVVRVLTVIGFLAVITGVLWGSILLARMTPGAFSTLASAIVSITSVFVPADEGAPDEEDGTATSTPEAPTDEGVGATPGTGAPQEPKRGEASTDIDVIVPPAGTGTSDPNGYVDLTVRLLEIGLVDKATGEFTASSTPSRSTFNSRVAVRFTIENTGTRTSGQFAFNAILPTFPQHIYSSPTQPSLAPGDRVEYTLGFDSFEEDNEGELVVNVDPTSRINEPNKNNNLLREMIVVNE